MKNITVVGDRITIKDPDGIKPDITIDVIPIGISIQIEGYQANEFDNDIAVVDVRSYDDPQIVIWNGVTEDEYPLGSEDPTHTVSLAPGKIKGDEND